MLYSKSVTCSHDLPRSRPPVSDSRSPPAAAHLCLDSFDLTMQKAAELLSDLSLFSSALLVLAGHSFGFTGLPYYY